MSDIDTPKSGKTPKAAPSRQPAPQPAPAALSAPSWPMNAPPAYRRPRSGLISDMFALRVLSEPRQRRSAVGESGHYTTKFFSFPLLSPRRARTSAVGKSGFVSTGFWPFPLLSSRKRTSAVGEAGTVFSDALGWGTLSRRR